MLNLKLGYQSKGSNIEMHYVWIELDDVGLDSKASWDL